MRYMQRADEMCFYGIQSLLKMRGHFWAFENCGINREGLDLAALLQGQFSDLLGISRCLTLDWLYLKDRTIFKGYSFQCSIHSRALGFSKKIVP